MTIVYGILGLGFLVLFHETGHFIAARLCGVTVEAFSIGMGPVLLHHKKGTVDYRLSLIPLGGYCSMKGEKDIQNAIETNSDRITGDKDSFYGVHPLKRLLIAFAGPFFNFLFTFIAFFIIALMGYTYYSAGTQIDTTAEVEQYSSLPSPAYDSGMRSGDRIISMNGEIMEDFSDIAEFISIHADEDITIVAERNGTELTFRVHTLLDKDSGSGKLGILSRGDSIVQREYPKHNFFEAIGEGFSKTFKMTGVIFKGFEVLFKGVNISKSVSGPARITSMLGNTVKTGFSVSLKIGIISTLEFLALLSISLFVMNLLPIPVFDGGLILFSLIETVTGKQIKPKVLYYIQFVGIAFIAVLVVLALTGDIHYFIDMFKKN